MYNYFFKSVYLFMRIFVLTCLIGCGTVGRFNGIQVKGPNRSVRGEVFTGIAALGIGYYLGDTYFKKK